MVLLPNSDEPIAAVSETTTPDSTPAPITATPVTVTKPVAAATTPAETTKQNALSFADAVYHYSLEYPSAWDYTKADRGITVFFKNDHQPNHPTQFIVQPLVSEDESAHQSVQQVVDMGENAIRDKASDYKVVEDGLLPPNANKNENFHGRYVLYSYTVNNEPVRQLQVIFFKSPSRAQYVIDYISPEALFEADLPVARAIISSFTIS